jgi:hypothetical protein
MDMNTTREAARLRETGAVAEDAQGAVRVGRGRHRVTVPEILTAPCLQCEAAGRGRAQTYFNPD